MFDQIYKTYRFRCKKEIERNKIEKHLMSNSEVRFFNKIFYLCSLRLAEIDHQFIFDFSILFHK